MEIRGFPVYTTSFKMNLKEEKRLLQIECFEIFSRYQASTLEELNQKIIEGKAPEHPGWERMGANANGEWGSDHAKYLIIYKKSSKNSRFLVLNIQFWVQNNRYK